MKIISPKKNNWRMNTGKEIKKNPELIRVLNGDFYLRKDY